MNNIQLTRFLRLAGRLKDTPRTGWVDAGVPNPESVADHIYRTMLLSMVLSDQDGLDTEKTLRMALIHDLAEAVTGDQTPETKTRDHAAKEDDAMRSMFTLLPEKLERAYMELWCEYQRGDSPESRLVHAADKIEMVLQAREYIGRGEDADKLTHFFETAVDEYCGLLSDIKKGLDP
ncbi:HD domain-containing protein [Candidatus Bathyarchaeota archaeon]|nr:HD domain-containing protein [Candidatus Bathyarchaeota archaeon]